MSSWDATAKFLFSEGRAVALKFLFSEGNLMGIVGILAIMRHAVTLGLIGWDSADGDFSGRLVLEPMGDGLLDAVVRLAHEGRPPPWRDATARSKAVLGIVAGMTFVHSLDLIYGSLDPIHILLDATGEVRIASFGCSAPGVFPIVPNPPGAFSHPNIAIGRHASLRSMSMASRSLFICFGRPSRSSLTGTCMSAFRSPVITACWRDDPGQRPSFADLLMLV
jgi:hypothetical protein